MVRALAVRAAAAAARRTADRAARWEAADTRYREARAEAEAGAAAGSGRPTAAARARIDALAAGRNAIALGPPAHPTWAGDRLAAVDARIWAWYRLDIGFAWPRLWLILEEPEQNTVRAARTELDAAVTLAGWGVLCALPALWCWPFLLLGAGFFARGRRRTRTAVDTLAHLTEAAFDLRAATLARELGFDVPEGPLSPETGAQVTAHLRKHA